MKRLSTNYNRISDDDNGDDFLYYLYCANIRVLCDILILIKAILCRFSFSQVDTQFNKLYHNRLQGGDGATPGSFGGDMFVEDIKSGLRLFNCDEFLRSLLSS